VAFVIDGWALEIALTHYYGSFLELATLSKTAICCRVTPKQKAQVRDLFEHLYEETGIQFKCLTSARVYRLYSC
jgi:magnesium-transporting ATPase (P-type)